METIATLEIKLDKNKRVVVKRIIPKRNATKITIVPKVNKTKKKKEGNEKDIKKKEGNEKKMEAPKDEKIEKQRKTKVKIVNK